jgi:hypothetical protein
MILLVEWTQRDFNAIVFLLVIIGLHFLLKLTPLYKAWCLFWLVLFATLSLNFLKKSIKDWWNE